MMDNNESQRDQLVLGEHLIKLRADGETLRLGRTDSGARAQRRYDERKARLSAKREAKRKLTNEKGNISNKETP